MDELVLLLLDAGSGKCTTEVTEGSVYVLQVVFLLDARGSTSYSSNCVRVEHTDFGKEQSVSLAGCWTWDVGPMHLPLAQPSLLEERRKLDLPTRGGGVPLGQEQSIHHFRDAFLPGKPSADRYDVWENAKRSIENRRVKEQRNVGG